MSDPTVRSPLPGEPPAAPPGSTPDAAPAAPPATPAAALPSPPPMAEPLRPRDTGADPGRLFTIIFGLVLLGLGLWFFADQSLGLALPDIEWGRFWPVILIVLGGWIILGTRRRGRG